MTDLLRELNLELTPKQIHSAINPALEEYARKSFDDLTTGDRVHLVRVASELNAILLERVKGAVRVTGPCVWTDDGNIKESIEWGHGAGWDEENIVTHSAYLLGVKKIEIP